MHSTVCKNCAGEKVPNLCWCVRSNHIASVVVENVFRSRDRGRDLDKMNSSALKSRDHGLQITTLHIADKQCYIEIWFIYHAFAHTVQETVSSRKSKNKMHLINARKSTKRKISLAFIYESFKSFDISRLSHTSRLFTQSPAFLLCHILQGNCFNNTIWHYWSVSLPIWWIKISISIIVDDLQWHL